MRADLLVGRLSGGGAERAVVTLADGPGFAYGLLVERDGGELAPRGAELGAEFLAPADTKASRARRVARLARALRRRRPAVAISFLSPLVHASAAQAAGVPIAHWVRARPRGSFRLTGTAPAAVAQRALLRATFNSSPLVACVSPRIRDELSSIGVDDARMIVLPGPVDLRRVPAGHVPPVTGGPIRIVTVARLDAPKRHDLLLEAISEVGSRHDLELSIIGDGELRERIARQSRQLGLESRVKMLGWMDDPLPVVASSDLFVLSTDSEGLPTVILEALACGLPVVASDVPDGPRMALNGDSSSHLVEPGSSAALAAGIERALAQDLRSGEARAERARRASDFGRDRVIDEFERELAGRLSPA